MLKDTEECANWYVYGWLEGIPDISKPWHAEGHEFLGIGRDYSTQLQSRVYTKKMWRTA
jgi:hypothetical protein